MMSYATEQGNLNGQYNVLLMQEQTEEMRQRPSVLYRANLAKHELGFAAYFGDWTDYIYPAVVGFGKTPQEAMEQFDKKWKEQS